MTTLKPMYDGVAGSPETIITVQYIAGSSATITVEDASVLPAAPNRVVLQRSSDLWFVTVFYGTLVGNVLGVLTPEAGLTTGTFPIGSTAARRFCEGDHKELRDNITALNDGKAELIHAARHEKNGDDKVSLDASQVVSGVFDVDRIPRAVLETVVTVADDTARYALTSAEVSIGDTVKVISTNKLWLVVDLANLDSDAGYTEYTSALLAHAETHEDGGADEIAIDASQIATGIIDIARIPHAAMETMVVVADDTARFALTWVDVQLGDTVKVTSTDFMFIVVDELNLDSEAGYVQYTAVPIPHASTHATGESDALAATDIGVEEGAQVNVIEDVKVGGTSLTITSKSVDVPKASSSVLGVVKTDNVTIFADANAVISAKTTITTDSASTTPTQTLAHNNEYRFTNAAITTIGITVPSGLADDFIASVVWRNPASTATYTLTNNSGLTLKNSGTDVSAGTFTPVVNKTYNMIYFNDGVNLNCVIRGV